MKELRTAVVGVGHLGRFHAQKYATLPGSRLVAVVDCDLARAEAVAAELGVCAYGDYRQSFEQVDAVSIAVPAAAHCEVASSFLARGIHVLLEKPIATCLKDADALLELAARHGATLQIGHLERYNPAVLALDGVIHEPLFIECHRLFPFRPRGTDVSVVLDLMVHDIDLVLDLVAAPVARIDASGAAVVSADIDIANARIQFDNGCTANVTASRVSQKTECKMRIFQRDAYLSLDLHGKRLRVHRRLPGEAVDGGPLLATEEPAPGPKDALRTEISDFLQCVRESRPPRVGGLQGRRALETALVIGRLLGRCPALG